MNNIKQLIENLRQPGLFKSKKSLELEVAEWPGALDGSFEFAMETGQVSGLNMIAFNIFATKQILMWSDLLNTVIDLAQIKPGLYKMPTCYAAMLACQEGNLWHPLVGQLASGQFGTGQISGIADLLVNAAIPGPLATIVKESVARNYPDALK